MSTRKRTPAGEGAPAGSIRETAGAFLETPQNSQAPEAQGRLQMVQSLKELAPGTYKVKYLDNPRGWIAVISRFHDGNVKVRISAMTPRGLVQILNVNAGRLPVLINILKDIYERLPEDVKTSAQQEQQEGW
jgi:hypothetical protein